MPVAVHGIQQKAVRNLAPATCAPLPGEGAGRHWGRLGAAARIHHGLQRAGSRQGERDKTGAMQKLVISALESEPVPPPELLEGSSRARAGRRKTERGKEGVLPAAAACLLFSSFVLGPRAPLNFPALAAADNFSSGTVKTPRARLRGALHPSRRLLPAPASAHRPLRPPPPPPSFAARLQQMRVKPTHRRARPLPRPRRA